MTTKAIKARPMLWRLVLVSLIAFMAAGCATPSGPGLGSLATLAPPAAGTARVVVIRREKGFFGWGDRSFRVKLDGQPMGDLKTAGFVYLDRPPGRHQLEADLWDFPGVSRHDFDAAAGRTYYFLATLNEDVNKVSAVSMVSPLAGLVGTAAAFGEDRSAVNLAPMSEAEARQTMAALPQP